jgi:hypothetical protein
MAGFPEMPNTDPTPETPPDSDSPFEQPPFERPPFDQDPEAQRAPGAGHEDPDAQQPPPMQASAANGPASTGDNVILLDGPGVAQAPVGNDNIRDGTVGGVMGGAHQAGGQGQGG